MDGPGDNYYLWYDTTEKQFTVLSWDLNLALSGMGGGVGGMQQDTEATDTASEMPTLSDGMEMPEMPTNGEMPQPPEGMEMPDGMEMPGGEEGDRKSVV